MDLPYLQSCKVCKTRHLGDTKPNKGPCIYKPRATLSGNKMYQKCCTIEHSTWSVVYNNKMDGILFKLILEKHTLYKWINLKEALRNMCSFGDGKWWTPKTSGFTYPKIPMQEKTWYTVLFLPQCYLLFAERELGAIQTGNPFAGAKDFCIQNKQISTTSVLHT